MNSYLQLFLTGVQPGDKRSGKGTVVAFTSSQPAEGVSYVAGSFGVELARKTRRRTLIADLNSLQSIDMFHQSRVSKFCYQTRVKNLFVLPTKDQLDVEEEEERNSLQLQHKAPESDFDRGLSNLQTLRFVFDFILLDCPSLKASGDAALFAEAANAVIIVVEADRTRKEQVSNTIQTIEMAKGNLIGCVLNKRQYPVPEWLYQRI
jgi:Mrp family chromosome partitioning ATPase